MIPVDFPEANRLFSKPADMTEEECQPLRVHDTGEALVSCWKLSSEELAEVQRTGRVWLWVIGRGHPPVAVEVTSPFSPTPAAVAEPERGEMERCPATPDGRLPPDEISSCEFCIGTAYCAGLVDEPPADLAPRICLRVQVEGDDEALCGDAYGDWQDDPARLTCEKCRRLHAGRAA